METKIVEVLEFQIDWTHTELKPDVLFLKLKGGGFFICDKEYGIQNTENNGIMKVKRIFGAGKSGSGGAYGNKKNV